MNTLQRPAERKTVVYTTKAKCRDCYRCVRVCPVHAIKMENGQAQVITENCIACGTCIKECPQHAKTYTTDYGKVLQMIENKNHIIASVAPSFAGYYNEWEQKRIPSALRILGFNYIAETSAGAWHTALASLEVIKEKPLQNHICTACPAIVNYITIYAPEYSQYLIPVSSPMVSHARILKQKYPKSKFVFIGPCIAKKDEANRPENEEYVDAAITFDELEELFKLKNLTLKTCEESSFDQEVSGDARLFPLEGGLLRTAGMSTDMLDSKIIALSGFQEIKQVLESLHQEKNDKIILEPLFCRYGCINGPVANKEENIFSKREAVLEYARNKPGKEEETGITNSKLFQTFFPAKHHQEEVFSEEQITEILASTGKFLPEDELNCMACGYNSCREKAVAVLQGIAESSMCMPYMRRMAEKQFDTLIGHDPNGIVILDSNLNIAHMNNAFKKMFTCSDTIIGKRISYLIDPESFEKIATGNEKIIRDTIHYDNYNLVCFQISYSLPDQHQYIGIFVDITDIQSNREKLADIRSETMNKAQELLDHQINMAQELARFLGEHTAKEEILLKKLIDTTKK